MDTLNLEQLRIAVNRVVAANLPITVLKEEMRLHGRRHSCNCNYHDFIPTWLIAHMRYRREIRKMDNRLFPNIDGEYLRARSIFLHADEQRRRMISGELCHQPSSAPNAILVSSTPASRARDDNARRYYGQKPQ